MRTRPLIATGPDWACAETIVFELSPLDMLYLGTVRQAMIESGFPPENIGPGDVFAFALVYTADEFRRAGLGSQSDD